MSNHKLAYSSGKYFISSRKDRYKFTIGNDTYVLSSNGQGSTEANALLTRLTMLFRLEDIFSLVR